MNIFIHQLSKKCLLTNAYRMSHSRFFSDEQTCSTIISNAKVLSDFFMKFTDMKRLVRMTWLE